MGSMTGQQKIQCCGWCCVLLCTVQKDKEHINLHTLIVQLKHAVYRTYLTIKIFKKHFISVTVNKTTSIILLEAFHGK